MAQATKTAPVATAAPKGKTAPVAAPVAAAPSAPRFTLGGWPAKAMGGNTVRAYCYTVAKQLAAANPNGFTLAQYAEALVANAAGSDMRQPDGGWATAEGKPNGKARQHAAWFAATAQGWLAPATAPAKA